MDKGSTNGGKIINIDSMKEYYELLDPVDFKYKELLENKDIFQKWTKASKEEIYIKFSDYEDAQQFEELTKSEFHHLQANLDMAYANKGLTDELFEIYNLVGDKIVRRYINIDGIERLFSEKYANFEWEMHLGMDHKKHSMNFYRDHFIHQIKDAYTMAWLLETKGFYEKVKSILLDTGSSKVSRYVDKMLKQQKYLPKRKVFEGIEDKIMREHYIYNIIYMASYMAGLFHDIGYPTVSDMQEQRQMIDYMAENHFFDRGNYDFNSIMALLQNSLLFRVVSPSEIRSRIEGDKIDHGTVSALLFLLHFYENGAIYRLEPYKLCAVEMAGLAIYNHTNHYTYIGQKHADYERCVFALNPISYLLRICDDLQEWGRIYFEVSQQTNLIICDKCHIPIRRVKSENRNTVKYECDCESKILFAPIFDYYKFPYRRIFNVSVCDDMEVLWEGSNSNYQFRLKYDLGKLLHIAYINPGYARYRIRELAQMKHLFPRQHSLGMVFVDYFVTSNIILIKSKIVGEYIKKSCVRCQDRIEEDINDWIEGEDSENIMDEKVPREILYTEIKSLEEYIFQCAGFQGLFDGEKPELKQYLKSTFKIYIFIYLMMCLGEKVNTEYPLLCDKIDNKILDVFSERFKIEDDKGFYTKDIMVLINDCRVQIGNMYRNLSHYSYYPENYFKTFQLEEEKEAIYYDALERFVNIETYEGIKDLENKVLDAFTDLYWFREILKKIEKMKERSL